MSDYTQIEDFSAKDALAPGDPDKVISGADIDAELAAISTAIATKANSASPTLTGTVTINGATVAGNATISGGNTHSGNNTFSGDNDIKDTLEIYDPSDTTKKIRLDAGSITTGTTRVITMGDADFTLRAATQAEQETGSSNTVIVTPGRQQYHPSAAKAWVSFDGSASIQSSYNVSSITDHAAGEFTVNFTTAFSSAYTGVGMAGKEANVGGIFLEGPTRGNTSASANGRTTSTFRVAIIDHTGSLTDPSEAGMAFYGDQ